MDCSQPDSSVHGDSPGKNTWVGCHALLQGIFPNQGSNPGCPYCRRILYKLSYQGSPWLSMLQCKYHLKIIQVLSSACTFNFLFFLLICYSSQDYLQKVDSKLHAEYIMRNAGLKEAQAGIKITRRNINNLRYADDTTLMAESEELKSLLLKVKKESRKAGLKLSIQKTKSWHLVLSLHGK